MPVLFNAQIQVDKSSNDGDEKHPWREQFSEEEIQQISIVLIDKIDGTWRVENTEYKAECSLEFVSPVKPLSSIVIPLPELRLLIADAMKQGISELPLPEILTMIRSVYQNKPT